MSFSADVFKKKLDALSETQDSIVSISQWVLFHHRHAPQLCELWAEYALANAGSHSSKKKLSLLYLCNDVVQQARHKRKPEFSEGFAASLPRVLYVIYRSVDEPIRPKVERLLSVWSQRNVFTKSQISAMERALKLSKDGEEFSDMPEAAARPKAEEHVKICPELADLNRLFLQMSQLTETGSANMASVGQQSRMYLPEDPATQDNLPSPKVYVSKLNVLEKLCHMTVQNVQDTTRVRGEILAALAQLTAETGAASAATENLSILEARLHRIHETKSELYEMIGEDEDSSGGAENVSLAQPQVQSDNVAITEPEPEPEPEPEQEEPSPIFDTVAEPISGTRGSLVPTYEDSSDDSDAETQPQSQHVTSSRSNGGKDTSVIPKKRRLSASSTSSGSAASKKSVAFSEQIEVKEYERDEQSNFIDIIGDRHENDDDDNNNNSNNDGDDIGDHTAYGEQNDGYDKPDVGQSYTGHGIPDINYADEHTFEEHHKDDLELLHERQGGAYDESDAHNGTSSTENDNDNDNGSGKSGLLSLLSKLS